MQKRAGSRQWTLGEPPKEKERPRSALLCTALRSGSWRIVADPFHAPLCSQSRASTRFETLPPCLPPLSPRTFSFSSFFLLSAVVIFPIIYYRCIRTMQLSVLCRRRRRRSLLSLFFFFFLGICFPLALFFLLSLRPSLFFQLQSRVRWMLTDSADFSREREREYWLLLLLLLLQWDR